PGTLAVRLSGAITLDAGGTAVQRVSRRPVFRWQRRGDTGLRPGRLAARGPRVDAGWRGRSESCPFRGRDAGRGSLTLLGCQEPAAGPAQAARGRRSWRRPAPTSARRATTVRPSAASPRGRVSTPR